MPKTESENFEDHDLSIFKEIYENCKYSFELESKRFEILERTNKIYISLLSIVLGSIFFKIETFVGFLISKPNFGKSFIDIFLNWGSLILLLISIVSFAFSLFHNLAFRKTKEYGSPWDPLGTILADESENMFQYYLARAADYAKATEKNWALNNIKADYLDLAVKRMKLGFLAILFLIIMHLINSFSKTF